MEKNFRGYDLISIRQLLLLSVKKLLPTKAKKKIRGISKYLNNKLFRKILAPRLSKIIAQEKFTRIIIFAPTIDWNWMKQRPHHLAEQFAQKGNLVFFCCPQNQTDILWGFSRISDRLYLSGGTELLKGVEAPVLFISSPDEQYLIKEFHNPVVIYDYLDDLKVPSDVVPSERIENHNRLLAEAHVITVTATRLFNEVYPLRPDVLLVQNAVNVNDFSVEFPTVPTDLKDIIQTGKPIIGYYGALARWFDYDLLSTVAELRPMFNFVLIGPAIDGSLEKELKPKDNIIWLGQKRYEELSTYLNCFDVAILPFKVNDITRSTSPVKIFEYFAGGKPVVSTDLDECIRYADVLLISKNFEEFANNIDLGLKLSGEPLYLQKLRKVTAQNTWDLRADIIIKKIT